MFKSQVSNDLSIVAEAILVFYILISVIMIVIIYYFVFVGRAVKIHLDSSSFRKTIVFSVPIVFLTAIFPVVSLASARYLFEACLFFAFAIVLFGTFYFVYFRPIIKPNDFRIQYTVAIWAIVTAVIMSSIILLFQFSSSIKIEGEFKISYDVLIQTASVIVSALGIVFTYVMRTEQTQRNSQQQLYQTLELQSVELFRFECDRPELVKALWFDEAESSADGTDEKVKSYILRQYVCQMLNLFEMAVRFRLQGILSPDVFGSWVIWIWELCESSKFQSMWHDANDLPANYVRELRDIVTTGVIIAADGDQSEIKKRIEFFSRVATQLDCPEINNWLKRPSA